MPAYNEAATVVSVLERLEPLADELIVVDDGSTDATRAEVLAWAEDRPNVKLICFPTNRGMSAAYYRAFEEVAKRYHCGSLAAAAVILTVDADGQHDPDEVDDLVDYMQTHQLDALIARRDLSTYSFYKRLGNFLISLWASFWAGERLYDVESGYRAFRVGALLTALRYYKGYRYSETVEVAAILMRLGFRVDNSYLVPVPLFRSNTRLKDLAIDIAALPAAAWRVETRRGAPAGLAGAVVDFLPLIGPAVIALICLVVLLRVPFLADDSMQHYSHVWYLADQLFHHARLPVRINLLDSGGAMTFPYAFVPYLTGAALHPVFGDWAVNLLMVGGFVGSIYAATLARPALRNPWLLLIFFLNPFLIDSLLAFQFASVWSAAFFFLFVWQFERGGTLTAVALFWLTVTSHPLMGSAAMSGYAVYLALFARGDLRRFAWLAIVGGLAAAPFYVMTLATPAASESSPIAIVLSFLDTVVRRITVLFLPFVLTAGASYIQRNYVRVVAPVCCLTLLGVGFGLGVVRIGDLNRGSYPGLVDNANAAQTYSAFFASPAFQLGATYRVMEPTDREDGVYRFMQHGAVISNDFFQESYQRRDWTQSQLACYASFKSIDFDVIEAAYDARYGKNETAVLRSVVPQGLASVAYTDPRGRFVVYDVSRLAASVPKPASLGTCGI